MSIKKENYSIHPLKVLEDNIIWILTRGQEAVVVDPSTSGPVQKWLEANNCKLISILQTHHHDDHIGGTRGLKKQWPDASVIASKDDLERIPFQTISVKGGDELFLINQKIKVLDVTGHTKAHIAFYFPGMDSCSKKPSLFCGDTLFGAGCGRVFEGTFAEMYKSLQTINSLPSDTQIYCAHEYTLANLKWAASICPEDTSIKRRLDSVSKIIKRGGISLPSSISEERDTNLFFKAKSIEEFTYLRNNKDNWRQKEN